MTDLIWPRDIFIPEAEEWQRPGVFTSGGRLVSGALRGGRTDGGGLWTYTAEGIVLERLGIKLWRAIHSAAGDGVREIIVPMCEAGFRPMPPGNWTTSDIPHSDDTLFSDDTGYAQDVIEATFAASATLRATTVQLDMSVSGPLTGGERFSVDHEIERKRLYEIGEILSVDGTVHTVTIEPPLRGAVASGTAADFNKPGCVMIVADPNTMGLKVISGTWAEKSIMFVEAP